MRRRPICLSTTFVCRSKWLCRPFPAELCGSAPDPCGAACARSGRIRAAAVRSRCRRGPPCGRAGSSPERGRAAPRDRPKTAAVAPFRRLSVGLSAIGPVIIACLIQSCGFPLIGSRCPPCHSWRAVAAVGSDNSTSWPRQPAPLFSQPPESAVPPAMAASSVMPEACRARRSSAWVASASVLGARPLGRTRRPRCRRSMRVLDLPFFLGGRPRNAAPQH